MYSSQMVGSRQDAFIAETDPVLDNIDFAFLVSSIAAFLRFDAISVLISSNAACNFRTYIHGIKVEAIEMV
jgi:hypothetical protein